MGSIFAEIEDKLPIEQVLSDAVNSLQDGPGSQDLVVERLDKIILLLGILTFSPKAVQTLPRVYKIKLSQYNIGVSIGLSKPANSITFLKPDSSFTVKLQLLIDDIDTVMTESKTIPSGRDTKIDGSIISDIIYSNAAVVGANDVEVTAVWI